MSPDRTAILDAVLVLLNANGLSALDLAAHQARASTSRQSTPTVGEYVARVRAIATSGVLRTYDRYWRLLVERLGDRLLTDVPSMCRRSAAGRS